MDSRKARRDRKGVLLSRDRLEVELRLDLRWSGRSKGRNVASHGLRGYGQPNGAMDISAPRALSTNLVGRARQRVFTPQRHPDHQLAATSSPLISSTASPPTTSTLVLATASVRSL